MLKSSGLMSEQSTREFYRSFLLPESIMPLEYSDKMGVFYLSSPNSLLIGLRKIDMPKLKVWGLELIDSHDTSHWILRKNYERIVDLMIIWYHRRY